MKYLYRYTILAMAHTSCDGSARSELSPLSLLNTKMIQRIVFCSIALFLAFQSCQSYKAETGGNQSESKTNKQLLYRSNEPSAIVYKTRNDYSALVPVIMNDAKTKIISYPAPSDIYYNGSLAKPTKLKNEYYLDNRGINKNVVFVDYTYEEYAALDQTPKIEILISKIRDRHPLLEMINCGIRSQYTNEVKDINKLIDEGFKPCSCIEIYINDANLPSDIIDK